MKKNVGIVLLALAVALAFVPASAYAASSVSMTTYQQVVKSGSTVYVASPGWGIYKATVKNNVVKSKKWLVKETNCYDTWSYITRMKKKGNFLYYISTTEGTPNYLNRVNISSGKVKQVAENVAGYACKGKKLYAELYDPEYESGNVYRVMSLAGASKKATSVKPVTKLKTSSAKGYSAVYKVSGGYVKTYLKTPKGKYYLGKVKQYTW